MEKITSNHNIYNTTLLIQFLKDQLPPQEAEKIRAAMEYDNLLKEVVEGLEIGLELETDQISLQEELSKSEEELLAWMESQKEAVKPYPNPKIKFRLNRTLASLLCIVLLLCPSQAKYADSSETTTTKALEEEESKERATADMSGSSTFSYEYHSYDVSRLPDLINTYLAFIEVGSEDIIFPGQLLRVDGNTQEWESAYSPIKELEESSSDPLASSFSVSPAHADGHSVSEKRDEPADRHPDSSQKIKEQANEDLSGFEEKAPESTANEWAIIDQKESFDGFVDEGLSILPDLSNDLFTKHMTAALDDVFESTETEASNHPIEHIPDEEKGITSNAYQIDLLRRDLYLIEEEIVYYNFKLEEAERSYQFQLYETATMMPASGGNAALKKIALLKRELINLKKERAQKMAELKELEAAQSNMEQDYSGLIKALTDPDRYYCSAIPAYGSHTSTEKSNAVEDSESEEIMQLLHAMLQALEKQEASKKSKVSDKGEWIVSNKSQVDLLKKIKSLTQGDYAHTYKGIVKDKHQLVLLDACHSDPKDFKTYFHEVKKQAKLEEKRTNIPIKIIVHYNYVKSGYDQSKNIQYADHYDDQKERSISLIIDQACSRDVSKSDRPTYSPGAWIQHAEVSDNFKINTDHLLGCSYLKGLADAGSKNMDEWVYGIAQYDQENPYLGVLLGYSLEEDKQGLLDRMR